MSAPTTAPGPSPTGGRAPAIRGLSHLSLSVRDLDRSLRFYAEVLGLPVLREPFDGVVFRGRQAMVTAGRILLSLQQHDDADAAAFAPTRAGLDHLAFDVDGVELLQRWRERLAAAGVPCSDVMRVEPFGWMIELRDPDGIQLELFTTGEAADRDQPR